MSPRRLIGRASRDAESNTTADAEAPDADGADAYDPEAPLGDGSKPSTMQGNEYLYGHLVAALLVAVAILNFAIRHGVGAPKHPATGLDVIGLVAAIALFPLLRTRNRFVAPFAAVIAAFFITLPHGPNSLQSVHVVAIIFPLVYALVLTQRQRKAAMAQVKTGGARGRSPRSRGLESARKNTKQTNPKQPVTPTRSGRYTPPKSKRAKR